MKSTEECSDKDTVSRVGPRRECVIVTENGNRGVYEHSIAVLFTRWPSGGVPGLKIGIESTETSPEASSCLTGGEVVLHLIIRAKWIS